MTTWRKELIREMERQEETWNDLVKIYFDGDLDHLDHEWEDYDYESDAIVMAWSKERVYFTDFGSDRDGAMTEFVSSAPRNPPKEKKKPR